VRYGIVYVKKSAWYSPAVEVVRLISVCRLPLSRVILNSVRLKTTSFSCLERRQLHLVLEHSPHPDLTLGTLCPLSSIIHLCLWTVSNVHSRLFCSVRRLGFLVVTGACLTIFVNCLFIEMSVYYYYYVFAGY